MCAGPSSALGEGCSGVGGIGLSIAGKEAPADQIVHMEERPDTLEIIWRAELHFGPQRTRTRGRALQLGPAFGVAGCVNRARLAEPRRLTGFRLQFGVETRGIGQNRGQSRVRSSRAHETGGVPGGAARELPSLQQHHTFTAEARQVVGQAQTDDAATNDDDGRVGRRCGHDHCRSSGHSLERFDGRQSRAG